MWLWPQKGQEERAQATHGLGEAPPLRVGATAHGDSVLLMSSALQGQPPHSRGARLTQFVPCGLLYFEKRWIFFSAARPCPGKVIGNRYTDVRSVGLSCTPRPPQVWWGVAGASSPADSGGSGLLCHPNGLCSPRPGPALSSVALLKRSVLEKLCASVWS